MLWEEGNRINVCLIIKIEKKKKIINGKEDKNFFNIIIYILK